MVESTEQYDLDIQDIENLLSQAKRDHTRAILQAEIKKLVKLREIVSVNHL
jgi:Siah interacting protein, N terminal